MPPISAIGIALPASSVSREAAEADIEQQQDQRDGDRHGDGSRCIALLRLPNSPTHSSAVAARQLDLLGDPLLRLEHGAAEVAAAHRELDRDVALLLLAVDVEGAATTSSTLATSVSGTWITPLVGLHADRDALDRLEVLAIARRQPHHHREVAVAAVLVEVARRLAADRRLHRGVDVAGREAVARGALRGRCRCGWSAGRARRTPRGR